MNQNDTKLKHKQNIVNMKNLSINKVNNKHDSPHKSLDLKERSFISDKNKKFVKTKGSNNINSQALSKKKFSAENSSSERNRKNNDLSLSENDDDSNSHFSSDSEAYDNMRPGKKEKTEKKNIGLIAQTLLESKKQVMPFKKEKQILEEEKEQATLLSKKRQKQIQRKLGYQGNLKNWESNEKELLKTATKGVVKLFNNIYNIKRQVVDEHKQELVEREKKSKNFLMMHDLAGPSSAPSVSKTFKEDEN